MLRNCCHMLVYCRAYVVFPMMPCARNLVPGDADLTQRGHRKPAVCGLRLTRCLSGSEVPPRVAESSVKETSLRCSAARRPPMREQRLRAARCRILKETSPRHSVARHLPMQREQRLRWTPSAIGTRDWRRSGAWERCEDVSESGRWCRFSGRGAPAPVTLTALGVRGTLAAPLAPLAEETCLARAGGRDDARRRRRHPQELFGGAAKAFGLEPFVAPQSFV